MSYSESLPPWERAGSSDLEQLEDLYWLVEHDPENLLAPLWQNEIDKIRKRL